MFKRNLKIIAYTVFITSIILIIGFAYKNNNFQNLTPQYIKTYINSFGVLAPLVYLLMFTFVPLTFFPDSILAIASGLAFGLGKGLTLTVIGALLGGTLSFYISRLLGREAIKKLVKKEIPILNRDLKRSGFFIIVILRLIPLFPFDLISYGAGLSKIKYREFIFGSTIGILPGVYVFANIGAHSSKPNSLGFIISLVLLLGLILLGYILKKLTTTKTSKYISTKEI